jgi:hypothetical protein
MSSSNERNRELPLVSAEALPEVIRTGDRVRVSQPGCPRFDGRFVGWGIDSVTDRSLLFVQGSNGGVAAFVADETRLTRRGGTSHDH